MYKKQTQVFLMCLGMILASSSLAAPLLGGNYCDPQADYIAVFSATNSIEQPVSILFNMKYAGPDATVIYHNYDKFGTKSPEYGCFSISNLKDLGATQVSYRIVEIDGKHLKQCSVTVDISTVQPGKHKIEVSKNASSDDYSCQQIS